MTTILCPVCHTDRDAADPLCHFCAGYLAGAQDAAADPLARTVGTTPDPELAALADRARLLRRFLRPSTQIHGETLAQVVFKPDLARIEVPSPPSEVAAIEIGDASGDWQAGHDRVPANYVDPRCGAKCPARPEWTCARSIGHTGQHETAGGGKHLRQLLLTALAKVDGWTGDKRAPVGMADGLFIAAENLAMPQSSVSPKRTGKLAFAEGYVWLAQAALDEFERWRESLPGALD
jgi:hypothetical protein